MSIHLQKQPYDLMFKSLKTDKQMNTDVGVIFLVSAKKFWENNIYRVSDLSHSISCSDGYHNHKW